MSVKNKISKGCASLANLPLFGFLKPKPKVAVLRLAGVIADAGMKRGALSHAKLEKYIDQAFDVYDLKAVALVINSPGGSPVQSTLIADHIRRKADEDEVPVYAFVEDVAASGGYWLACAADEIYANEASIVGSIGVVSASFGFKDLMEKHGVERRIHTAGKQKSFLDPFMEEKPADIKRLKDLQSALHARFIEWVTLRRGDILKGKNSELFEGQFWIAAKAKELGLIDGFGEAKSMMKGLFGDDIRFVDVSPEKKVLPSLLGADMKADLSERLVENAMQDIETRALWGRFGL